MEPTETAESLAFLVVSRAPTRFIDPPPTDVPLQYIPPPRVRPGFPFKISHRAQYSTLYGLLVVMKRLLDLSNTGRVEHDTFTAEFAQLRDQFEHVNQGLKFSRDALEKFAFACSLDCGDVINQLFSEDARRPRKDSVKLQTGFSIGEHITTLMDMSKLENTAVSQLLRVILALVADSKKVPTPPEVEARLKYWEGFCRERNVDYVLSKEEKERLYSDAEFMHSAMAAAFGG